MTKQNLNVSNYKADNLNNRFNELEELFKRLNIYYTSDIYYQNKHTNVILTERDYYKMLLDDYLDDYFENNNNEQVEFNSMYHYIDWRLQNEPMTHDWKVLDLS